MPTMQLGRNDVCRCGSGKKFKKCCISKHVSTPLVPTHPTVGLAPMFPRTSTSPQVRRVVATPHGNPSLEFFEWKDHFFVKGKGWTHESELKPGDEKRLKDGSWVTVKPERTIETTHEHPFYVKGRGWTPAHEIRVGDLLRTLDGWIPVKNIEDTGEVKTVYNLRVSEHHTYFVGTPEWGFAVWSHNADCAIVRTITQAEKDALKGTPLANSTHVAEFNTTTGTRGKRYFEGATAQADAEAFVVQQRNRLAAADSALSRETPIAAGSGDRVIPANANEQAALLEAQGFTAGKPGSGHTQIITTNKPLGDAIYAGDTYQKWEYVTTVNGQKVVIHYVKNDTTGAIGHWKIKN